MPPSESELTMAWAWRYEDAAGNSVDGPNETFSNQSDAESWLGQVWRELVTSGLVTAVLCEDERMEYSMPLLPGERG
jgi:hypothetical protein